jgi:hypothetical protein
VRRKTSGRLRARSAPTTSGPPDGGDAPNCSFCGKSQRDARKLIHGPGACICDECVELCQDILAPSGDHETTVTPEEWEIVRRLAPAAALRALARRDVTRAAEEALRRKKKEGPPTKRGSDRHAR